MAKPTARDRFKYVKAPYVAASLLCHVIWDKDDIPRTEQQWYDNYITRVHRDIHIDEFSEALSDLLRAKFVTAYVDEFSPTFYKFFPARIVAWPSYPTVSDNIMAKYSNLGGDWLQGIFENIDKDDRFLPSEGESSSVIEVPASDRVVGINHNTAEWAEIDIGLSTIVERIEQDNEFSNDMPDAHSRVVAGAKAAKILWNATSIHILQIKIGIIMVYEEIEALTIEKYYGAAVAAVFALIKKFFKDQVKIDIDGIL